MPPKKKSPLKAPILTPITADNIPAVLQSLLAVAPQPALIGDTKKRQHWPEIEAIIKPYDTSSYGQALLVRYLIKAVKALPNGKTAITRNTLQLRTALVLIGKILDKQVLSDNSYDRMKTLLRDTIAGHFFGANHADKSEAVRKVKQREDMEAWFSAKKIQFDNSERTTVRNATNTNISTARHRVAYNISQKYIKEMIERMVADVKSGEYPYAIYLIAELALGARYGECCMSSTFIHEKDERNERKRTVSSDISAPRLKEMVRQTGLLKKGKTVDVDTNPEDADLLSKDVLKPCLPYVDAKWLIENLTKYRRSRGITQELERTYNIKLIALDRDKCNKLLQTRYLDGRINEQIRVRTHLLRAIYASAAFDLFSDKQETLNIFIQDKLGHDDMKVGLSYAYIKIVPDTDMTPLPVLDEDIDDAIDEPMDEPIEPPEQISPDDTAPVSRKEYNSLKKQLAELAALVQQLQTQLKKD